MAEPPHHSTQSAPTEPDSALNDPDRWNQKYKAASAQPSSGESPPTASHDQPDILRIIPVSSEARRAFDSVVKSKQAGTLHENHAKYVQVTGTAPLNAHTDASNESGVTTDEDNQTLSASRPVYQGYYSVRLSLLRVAPAPSWVCAPSLISSPSELLSYSLHSSTLSPAREIPIWLLLCLTWCVDYWQGLREKVRSHAECRHSSGRPRFGLGYQCACYTRIPCASPSIRSVDVEAQHRDDCRR